MVFGHTDSGVRNHRRAIGTFPEQHAAERALNELRDAGFPMDRVSIVARGPEPREDRGHTHHVGNKSDEGAVSGAVTGGLLGTITGLLVGMGTLAIPGVGPIMLTGAIATAVVTTLAGTGIGAVTGGLLGALIGLGIPEKDARDYHDRIMRGEYLLVVDGSDSDIARVEQILHHRRINAYNVYDAPLMAGAAGTRALEEPYYRRIHPAAVAHWPMGSSVVVHETPGHHPAPMPLEPYTVRPLEEPFYRRSQHSHTVPQPIHEASAPVRETPAVVPVRETPEVGGRQRAIASYANPHDAEEAITRLRQAGFPLSTVSLIARHIEQRDVFSGLAVRDRLEAARYGIPCNRSHFYDEHLDRGSYLVTVSGTEDEIRRAVAILATCGMTSWDLFDATSEHPIPEHRTFENRTTEESKFNPLDRHPEGVVGSKLPAHRPAPPPPPSAIASSAPPVPPPPSAITSPSAPVPPLYSSTSSIPPASSHPAQHYRAIGVFSRRQDTEAALSELRTSGFSMDQISILARDSGRGPSVAGVDIRQQTGNQADEGAKAGAATGAAVGGLGGLLVGLGTLAIPGIGPVIAGGAVATAIATTLTGGAIGAATGGIVGALVGLGIPENRARVYNERFNRGDDLIIMDGSEADIRHAESILKRHRIHEWERFEATKVQTQKSTRSDVRQDGMVSDRPSIKENERLGIRDERVDSTPAKRIRPQNTPEVIIVDRRHNPHQE